MTTEIGKSVKLRAYDGQEIVRRVVELRNETVYVCSEEEYKRAYQEKREPICVGFNTRYVLNND